jgi:hypothetical protein
VQAAIVCPHRHTDYLHTWEGLRAGAQTESHIALRDAFQFPLDEFRRRPGRDTELDPGRELLQVLPLRGRHLRRGGDGEQKKAAEERHFI